MLNVETMSATRLTMRCKLDHNNYCYVTMSKSDAVSAAGGDLSTVQHIASRSKLLLLELRANLKRASSFASSWLIEPHLYRCGGFPSRGLNVS